MKIQRFKEFNTVDIDEFIINEKINWKKVKKYGVYGLISLFAAIQIYPEYTINPVMKHSLEQWVSRTLPDLDNVNKTEKFQKALSR